MNRLARVVLIAGGSALTGVAGAQNNCDGNLNDFDAVYCYQKVFVQADRELNTVYLKLLSAWPSSGRASLRAAQRAWIAQRDQASVLTRDGFKYVSVDRATDLTVARTNELGDRLRECRSSGCRISKLR